MNPSENEGPLLVCVKVPKHISQNGAIYFHCYHMNNHEDGSISFLNKNLNVIIWFNKDNWYLFYITKEFANADQIL